MSAYEIVEKGDGCWVVVINKPFAFLTVDDFESYNEADDFVFRMKYLDELESEESKKANIGGE